VTTSNDLDITLDDLVEYHHVPSKYPHLYSPASWYHAVKHRNSNGLAPAFKKVGRILFVNVKMLAQIINT